MQAYYSFPLVSILTQEFYKLQLGFQKKMNQALIQTRSQQS